MKPIFSSMKGEKPQFMKGFLAESFISEFLVSLPK